MTTENGLHLVKNARRHINVLRDRLEYLEDKQAERIDIGLQPGQYIQGEIRALRFALPVLEAEFDNLLRLRRLIVQTEGRDPDKDGVDQGLFALNKHTSVPNV